MKIITVQMMTLLIIITVLVMVFKAASHNVAFSQQKNSTFECGFDLLSNLRLPFSLNFFIISIIFLIFDVELILLLPFIFMIKMEQMKFVLSTLVFFFVVLILGFIYEWWMGLLNWIL